VERFHKTMRAEFLVDHDRAYATIEEFQAALDAWVEHYNTERPHQSLGDRPPIERFSLASARKTMSDTAEGDDPTETTPLPTPRPGGVSRWVDGRGKISIAGSRYRVGPTFAGEAVIQSGLVAGVVVATHAQRRRKEGSGRPLPSPRAAPPRTAGSGISVTRMVSTAGSVSFSGADYRVGRSWRGRQVEVAIVAGSVQISGAGKVIRVHVIRHDRSKEHGAFATPNGPPRKPKVA
jgi:hypothetical protein